MKTQVVVHKHVTNIVEEKPGLIEEEVNKITELENKLSQAQLQIQQQSQEIESFRMSQKRFNELEKKFEAIEEEDTALVNKLSEKKDELEDVLKENRELKEWKERNMSELEEKNKQVEILQNKLLELDSQVASLEETKRQFEIVSEDLSRVSAAMKEKELEIENLTKKIEDEKCVNPKEHVGFSLQIKEINTLNGELNEFKQKFESLTKEHERQIQIVKDKTSEIADLNKTVEKLEKIAKQTMDEGESKVEKLKKEIDKLKQKGEEFKLEIKRLKELPNERIDELTSDVYKLNELLDSRDLAVAALEKEKMKLTTEIEHLKKSVEEHLETIKTKDVAAAKMKEEFDKLNGQITEYRDAFKILEQDRDNFIAERDKLSAELKSIQEQNTALQGEAERYKMLWEQNKVNVEILEKEIHSLTTQITDIHKEKQDLVKDNTVVAILEDKIRNLTMLFEKIYQERQDLLAENGTLKDRLRNWDNMKSEFDQAQKKVEYLTIERDKLIETLEERGVQMKKMSDDLEGYEVLKRKFEESGREIDRLKKQIAAQEMYVKEFDATVAKMKEIEGKLIDFAEKKEKLIQENITLSQRCKELEVNLTAINEKYHKMYSVYNKIKHVTENITKVQEKLSEACEETEKVC